MFGSFQKQTSTPGDEPPISNVDLKGLFEFLDKPNSPPCDHDHSETVEFLNSRKLPVESTLNWLRENGGFCDCEVIFNVTDKWGEIVGWEPKFEDE